MTRPCDIEVPPRSTPPGSLLAAREWRIVWWGWRYWREWGWKSDHYGRTLTFGPARLYRKGWDFDGGTSWT